MSLRSAVSCLLFFWATTFLHAQWEEVENRRLPYVKLSSFCDFYFFRVPEDRTKPEIELVGPYGKLLLKAQSRECFLDGQRIWLSYPVEQQANGSFILSKMDLIKCFEPVLRPERIAPRPLIKGVIIDAGHGGMDNGAIASGGIMEKDMTLDTALRLERLLKAKGIATVLTRRDDSFPSLDDRAKFTELYPDYIFVSIHFNQGIRTARGVETYSLTPQFSPSTSDSVPQSARYGEASPGDEHDASNILLATLVQREMRTLYPPEGDRGIKRARFAVLRRSHNPAILVEGGFLSNSTGDLPLIRTPDFRQKIAQQIADGITQYLAILKMPEIPVRKCFGVEFRDLRPTLDLLSLIRPPATSTNAIIPPPVPTVPAVTNLPITPLPVLPLTPSPSEPQDGRQPVPEADTHDIPLTSTPTPINPSTNSVTNSTVINSSTNSTTNSSTNAPAPEPKEKTPSPSPSTPAASPNPYRS